MEKCLWLFLVAVAAVTLPNHIELSGKLDVGAYEVVPETVGIREGDLRGLFALRPIKGGEELFRIPLAGHVLSREDILLRCPQLKAVYEALGDDYDEHLVGYCTAWLVTQGTQHPALAMLPRQCSDGGDFRQELATHMPPGSWELDLRWFDEEPMRHKLLMEKLAPEMHLEYSVYRWGVCVVRSRAFKPIAELQTKLGSLCLVPLGDLSNHHVDRENIKYTNTADHSAWSFHAVRDIDVGEELFDSYGCKSSLDMLRTYGFVPDGQDRCNWIYINNLSLQIDHDNHIAYGTEPMSYGDVNDLIELELSEYAVRRATASPLIKQLIDANARFLHRAILLISSAQHDEL